MALASNAGARFRQRKISVKQSLPIIKQKDIPDFDIEDQQRELQHIETGVEKGEEEEHHLQQVINASAAKFKGANVEQVFIPTPDASKVWTEYSKFYQPKFTEPESYIKFSATVEETSGCPYNMDERDEEFLPLLNKDFSIDEQCTEDEFELVCYKFDKIVDEKQPFLTMDPQQILSYNELKQYALDLTSTRNPDLHEILAKKLNVPKFKTLYDPDPTNGKDPRKMDVLLEKFGPKIYEHWKTRRIERGGKQAFPTIRFEDPSQKDDNNPYTSFRRREFRQARKTRRTDVQSVEKLKLLFKDLRRVENLLVSITERELKRSELLDVNKETFRMRCEFKMLKREGKITADDELLYDKPKKKRLPLGYVPPPPPPPAKAKSVNPANANNQSGKSKSKLKVDAPPNKKSSNKYPNGNNGNANGNFNDPNKIPQAVIQPYVKLPPSKVPDIDLTTVNTVLKDKLEGIKKAVSDKLIKRKLQDEGWINFTDDPYNPYFDMPLACEDQIEEKSHLPYSSIVSSMFEVENSREINFSHIFNNNRHYSHNDSEVVKINLSTGQVVKNDRHSYLPEFFDLVGEKTPNNEFGRSLEEVEEQFNEKNRFTVSDVLFKLRKRQGRGGRIWIDRKRIRDDDLFEEFLNLPEEDSEEETNVSQSANNLLEDKANGDIIEEKLFDEGENVDKMDVDVEQGKHEENVTDASKKRRNAYDCKLDVKRRLKSRFMFDSDLPRPNPLDPSKLNQIGKQTQAVRFGCMLLSKAYDNMHQIRQKQILHHQQKLQQQQQQREQILREQKEREKQLLRHQQMLEHQQKQQGQQHVNGSVNGGDKIVSIDAAEKSGKTTKTTKEKKVKKEPGEKKAKVMKKSTPKNINKNTISDPPSSSAAGTKNTTASNGTSRNGGGKENKVGKMTG